MLMITLFDDLGNRDHNIINAVISENKIIKRYVDLKDHMKIIARSVISSRIWMQNLLSTSAALECNRK